MPECYICLYCRNPFHRRPSQRKQGKGFYCSKACAMASFQAPQALAIRFWSHVQRTETCWLWSGKTWPNGYGMFTVHAKEVLAHRFSYLLHYGAIPEGMCILHNCPQRDNPSCIHPCHLFPGTQAENIADMIRKGHFPIGEKNGSAKLTDDEIQDIFALQGKSLQKHVALQYNISRQHVSRIWRRKTRICRTIDALQW